MVDGCPWRGLAACSPTSSRRVPRGHGRWDRPARRLVRTYVYWHASHTLARVVQHELGALPPDRYREIAALRMIAALDGDDWILN